MDDKKIQEITVNVEFLAEVFGVDIRTVQNYHLAGMPKNERGEYPLFACLMWQIKKLKEDIETLKTETPLKLSQKKAIDLNNERKDLELAKLRGDLLDRELVEQVNVTAMKMIARNIDAVAPRLNKKLGGDATMLSTIKQDLDELKTICASTPLNYFEDEQQTNEE